MDELNLRIHESSIVSEKNNGFIGFETYIR